MPDRILEARRTQRSHRLKPPRLPHRNQSLLVPQWRRAGAERSKTALPAVCCREGQETSFLHTALQLFDLWAQLDEVQLCDGVVDEG